MKRLILLLSFFIGALVMAVPASAETGLSPPFGVEINIPNQVAPEMVAMMPELLPVGYSNMIDANTQLHENDKAITPPTIKAEREAIGLVLKYDSNYSFILSP